MVTFLLYVNLAPYFWHHVVHLPLVLCCSIEHSTATMTFSLQSIILKFHYASRERFRCTVCVGNSARKRRHWIRNGTSRAVDFVFHVVPRQPAQSPSPFFLTRITLYFQSSAISASSGFVDNWRQPEHWFRFALVLAELIGTASRSSSIAC